VALARARVAERAQRAQFAQQAAEYARAALSGNSRQAEAQQILASAAAILGTQAPAAGPRRRFHPSLDALLGG
jgi:uncharacterized membrane protein